MLLGAAYFCGNLPYLHADMSHLTDNSMQCRVPAAVGSPTHAGRGQGPYGDPHETLNAAARPHIPVPYPAQPHGATSDI